jgi:hypothetical protein
MQASLDRRKHEHRCDGRRFTELGVISGQVRTLGTVCNLRLDHAGVLHTTGV